MSKSIDANVDHFKVMRLLGQGGMGEVYLARDTKLGRKVALKVIRPGLINSPKAMARFLTEARTTARFNHPNIVGIHAVGEHRGRPYLALEYLEGEDLRTRAAERQPSVQESMRIMLAVAEALAEAHRHGVLHRDLKPANIVIPSDGRVRVVDFGIAKIGEALAHDDDQAPPSGLIHPSSRAGTPAYMAPEQWLAQRCTGATDVWAVGVILFELCAGVSPFADDEPTAADSPSAHSATVVSPQAEIGTQTSDAPMASAPDAPQSLRQRLQHRMARVCGNERPPRLEQVADVGPALSKLVARCLDKDRANRPSAAELVKELSALLQSDRGEISDQDGPFRGLLPFTLRHADFFFGREAEVAAFVERMRLQPVLPVVGPSGAGKSSFIQAGVVARLIEQQPWQVISMRPGARPFATLAARLLPSESDGSHPSLEQAPLSIADADVIEHPLTASRLAKNLRREPAKLALLLRQLADERQANVLLFIDQMEELFTLCDSPELQQRFMQAICSAADDAHDPVRVVFTVRGDFLDRLITGPEARNALRDVTVLQRPDAEALEDILVKPLQAIGYQYEDPSLVSEMIATVGGELACLPLLQFAAQKMWAHRDESGRQLPRSAYDAIGGVEGALAKHADGVLDGLTAEQIRLARVLLLRLVTPSSTRRVVTRAAALDGLARERGNAKQSGDEADRKTRAEDVLTRLVKARLLTVRRSRGAGASESTVELAHEALISSWTTLSNWIEESKDELTFFADVEQAADLWLRRGRHDEELWSADALREALRMLDRSTSAVPELVAEFLRRSNLKEQRQGRVKRALIAAVIAALALVAGAAVTIAYWAAEKEAQVRRQRDEAERRRAEALREGARSALGQERMLEARAKLRMAFEIEDEVSARALWRQLDAHPLLWRKQLGDAVYSVAYAPDGKTVAVGCQDRTLSLIDVDTKAVEHLRGHSDQVLAVAYSPDGALLASASVNGELRLWTPSRPRAPPRKLARRKTAVAALAFSSDGRWLASAGAGRVVVLWDVVSGQLVKTLRGHEDVVRGLVFAPDGVTLASADHAGTVRIWNTRAGTLTRTLRGAGAGFHGVSISVDGKLVAAGSHDGTVRIWELSTGVARQPLLGHSDRLREVKYSPDGKWLASAGADMTVRLWDARSGVLLRTIHGHTSGVQAIAFSPDSSKLISGGLDRSARMVRPGVTAGRQLAPHTGPVQGVAFSRDGTLIATAGADKRIGLWEVASGTLQRTIGGHDDEVTDVVFSPDGTLLASTSLDNAVQLWSFPKQAVVARLVGHEVGVFSAAFSPDGKLLATAAGDKTVGVWNVPTASLRHKLVGHTGAVRAVGFNVAGDVIASAGYDKTVRLWSTSERAPGAVLRGHGGWVYGLAFSPDGKQLVSVGEDESLLVWPPKPGVPDTSGPPRRIDNPVERAYRIAFDPKGRFFAVAGSDGSARLWDLRSNQMSVLRSHRAEVVAVGFSADGTHLATTGHDETVRVWDTAKMRPKWNAPLLLAPLLRSQRGWQRLEPMGASAAKPPQRLGPLARETVELRARIAAIAPGDDSDHLCVLGHHDEVQLWRLSDDKRIAARKLRGAEQLVASPLGCAARSRSAVLLVDAKGAFHPLALDAKPTGLGLDARGQLLVATAREVLRLDFAGKVRLRQQLGAGANALLGLQPQPKLLVGFREGSLEVLHANSDAAPSFELTPSSPVTKLVLGPTDTIIAGYQNGTVGVWSLRSGKRLAHGRLHGPVVHLQLLDRKLYAASELGGHLVWNLSLLSRPYCQLLAEIRQRIPIMWRNGRAHRSEPLASHPCEPSDHQAN